MNGRRRLAPRDITVPGNLDLHTIAQSEVRFLEYRLEVIAAWPESGRKRILMEAIALRLSALRQV